MRRKPANPKVGQVPTQSTTIKEQIVLRPLIHLTLKQWADHPDLQAKLRVILEDPVFMLAQNTLLHASAPGTEPGKAEPGVSAEAANNALALRYAHRSGMGHSFRILKFLTQQKSAKAPGNPYGELLQEDE